MHAATAAETSPRMQADVMEIDIAEVIASLEAEQTLILSQTQLATFRASSHRRRRTIDAVGGVLLGIGGTFVTVLASWTAAPAMAESRKIGCVMAGLATLGLGVLMVARALRGHD